MRKPKHGEIWQTRDGSIIVFLDHTVVDMTNLDSPNSAGEIKDRIKQHRFLDGHMWVQNMDENGCYPNDNKYDMTDYICHMNDYLGETTAKEATGCKHNFITAPIKKNSLWCKLCGEYKPI